MKIRIIATLAILGLWAVLARGVFYTADVVANNKLVVATVNGGDAALAAQNTYNAGSHVAGIFGTLILLAILIGVWITPVKKAVESPEVPLNK